MKNPIKINKLTIIAALLLMASTGFAQEFKYTREKELAEKAFKSLQNADEETFSSYCITEDRLTKMLEAFDESNEKDKSIKAELSEVPVAEFCNEAIESFKKALEKTKTESVDLKAGTYPELAIYQTRFETNNVKCCKVKFDISVEKLCKIVLYMFETKDDIFIYDFSLGVHEVL